MNNNEFSMLDAQENNPPMVDFGAVFADGPAVCDYTNCIAEIGKFLSVIGGLMGRYLEKKELRECESYLRRQYQQRHPFAMGGDHDTHIYETPWQLANGTRICIRMTLLLRNSIKVPTANKKMSLFELCEPSGEPLGTMRTLPWHIDNYREIANAVRAAMRCRFPHELLGNTLACSWIKAGAKEDLPCTIYLGETLEGEDLSIRFRPVAGKNQDNQIHVKASLVVGEEEVSLQSLQPPLFKHISPECFNSDSSDQFNDMLGRIEFALYNDWLSVIKARYDYLWNFQNQHHMQEGIVPVSLQGGIAAEVFHTGFWTDAGEAVYGLCRDRGADGRWRCINWVHAVHLSGVGVTRLPLAPNWDLEWHPFDVQMSRVELSRHVLDHASRWASKESLTGDKDGLGHDVFVSDELKEEMYGYACKELSASIAYATAHPEEIAYGYYNPVVDRANGKYSPVAIFLPGFFVVEDGRKTPRAIFVLRLKKDGSHPYYEIPTILPVSYVRRSVEVLGFGSPSWVSGDTGMQTNIVKEVRLVA
jgi:hypothetical protein